MSDNISQKSKEFQKITESYFFENHTPIEQIRKKNQTKPVQKLLVRNLNTENWESEFYLAMLLFLKGRTEKPFQLIENLYNKIENGKIDLKESSENARFVLAVNMLKMSIKTRTHTEEAVNMYKKARALSDNAQYHTYDNLLQKVHN